MALRWCVTISFWWPINSYAFISLSFLKTIHDTTHVIHSRIDMLIIYFSYKDTCLVFIFTDIYRNNRTELEYLPPIHCRVLKSHLLLLDIHLSILSTKWMSCYHVWFDFNSHIDNNTYTRWCNISFLMLLDRKINRHELSFITNDT